MRSIIDVFEHSYVINLPNRIDRRKAITKELIKIGISLPSEKVTIFPAIKPESQGSFPSVGARGCFLSHLAILQEARKQGLNSVLIIEDDLAFSKQFFQQQDKILEQLQNLDWDFLYLGHVEPCQSQKITEFQSISRGIITASFLAINGRIIDQLVCFLETVLERPAGHPLGGPMHVDGAYSTFRSQNSDVTTLIAIPSLGFQRSSPSDIAGWKWFDYIPGLKQMGNLVRRAKTYNKNHSKYYQ